MKTISLLSKTFPWRASREDLAQADLRPALALILGTGLFYAFLFLRSHLAWDYPPPPDVLRTWIEAWGEFSMLPFLKIPAEIYRLAQAIFILPLMLMIWILMAGSTRLLSILWRGQASYDQYLSLFGASFFAFWFLGAILDTLLSYFFSDLQLQALRMQYGPAVRAFFVNFQPLAWTGALTLGGVYNAILTHRLEGFSFWKSALVGVVTLFWPVTFISFLIR